MASVRLQGVTKTYPNAGGGVRAVDNLTLTVNDGALVVLAGPSGCGKTTTLRLIAGLDELTSGVIRIGQRDAGSVPPKERDIAMVFQNYALYPHMTVFDNMAFGLRMHRVPKQEIRRKVHEVAALLDIERLLSRKPTALSGGERQRVAVGRAAVRTPQVFLFDEPLSNLDAALRAHTRTELKALHRTLQTTIVYVTHDQEEAMTLGDRIAVMRDGALQQYGPPLEVYIKPANRFVAGFIGIPSMNFLEGSLQLDGTGVYFSADAYRLRLPANIAEGLGSLEGRKVALGIRPEHVEVLAADSPHHREEPRVDSDRIAWVRDMSVDIVEPLGNCISVHLRTSAGRLIVARVPPTVGVTAGERYSVALDLSHAHIFEAEDAGRRLSR
ncbi:MAG: ATP-binding cassette domain-containing protein [Phycisphaerales bacterium]|nr:MAG: ATP-binding cassette domain-containing protein [Phycisphaerales bacterium]